LAAEAVVTEGSRAHLPNAEEEESKALGSAVSARGWSLVTVDPWPEAEIGAATLGKIGCNKNYWRSVSWRKVNNPSKG
jgi:hypothetical protein